MDTLISPEYRELLHEYRRTDGQSWGGGGARHATLVKELMDDLGCQTIIDYGCGRGALLNVLITDFHVLPENCQWYDPGVEGLDLSPKPADLLVSTDVLEHIEPDRLDNVLRHMRLLSLRGAYINVHTGPAKAILPDGRNAHLTQQPEGWWKAKLEEHYRLVVRDALSSSYRPTFLCHV